MRTDRSPEQQRAFDDWVAEAKAVTCEDEITRRGVKLAKGNEIFGPCPACGGKDRFAINRVKNIFICRPSDGGDVVDMVQHLDGCSFTEAVERITGRSPPGTEARPLSPEQVAERAERAEAAKAARAKAEQDEKLRRDRTRGDAWELFDMARLVVGSQAAAYLTARGLNVQRRWIQDLRFLPALEYHGFPDEHADQVEMLGRFPALLAAIRDVEGNLIGVHRTYLDPDAPAKLKPPGDATRNKPRKVLGEVAGGMIRLSPMSPQLAVGEGIETSQSWFALGLGGAEYAIAAAVSLGNLAGAATGTVPHSTRKRRDGKPVMIPNGIPDMERPGLILPREVEEVMILGDGDSDQETTRAMITVAAERFEAQGRKVFIDMATKGKDFNNLLLEAPEE